MSPYIFHCRQFVGQGGRWQTFGDQFFKSVKKKQNIFTIFDNFSLVRDQIKILTLYRSLNFENSRWRATPTSKYVSFNLSRALGEAGFCLIMKFKIFHIGAPRRVQGEALLPMTVIFSKGRPMVGCMPIFF